MKLMSYLAVLMMGLLFGPQVVAGTAADDISILDPYVRAMPPGQPTSLAFMGIMNNSNKDHALRDAEGTVAKKLELHTHILKNGMLHMRKVEKIDLPAGKKVMLQSGGMHVMLIGLKQDLKPGDMVAINLVFEDGSKKKLDVPVRRIMMMMKKQEEMRHDHAMPMKH
ncbi:MAG: copper chaperone PCu(A)C [Gammaproteobacteria bacterium]|nr:copper chaperone PCu(A)C [Gammaproteobacteria bacterium]